MNRFTLILTLTITSAGFAQTPVDPEWLVDVPRRATSYPAASFAPMGFAVLATGNPAVPTRGGIFVAGLGRWLDSSATCPLVSVTEFVTPVDTSFLYIGLDTQAAYLFKSNKRDALNPANAELKLPRGLYSVKQAGQRSVFIFGQTEQDKRWRIWRYNFEQIQPIADSEKPILDVAVTGSHGLLFGTTDGVYALNAGESARQLIPTPGPVYGLALDNESGLFVSSEAGVAYVRLSDAASFKPLVRGLHGPLVYWCDRLFILSHDHHRIIELQYEGATKPTAITARSAKPDGRMKGLSADQLRALQYYRWAEQLADGQRFPLTSQLQTDQPLTNAQLVSDQYITQTEKLIGGPTPRTQFLRTAIYAQQLTTDVLELKSLQGGQNGGMISKCQQSTDLTENHLAHYIRLADPTDSRYADALKLQNQLYLQRVDYGRFSKYVVDKQKYTEDIKRLEEQFDYYQHRETKAKKGRGILLVLGLGLGYLGLPPLLNTIRVENEAKNSAIQGGYPYTPPDEARKKYMSQKTAIAAAGGLLLTTAIGKYIRRGKFRRLKRDTKEQFDQLKQNEPTLKIEPKINVQLQFVGNGLVVKF